PPERAPEAAALRAPDRRARRPEGAGARHRPEGPGHPHGTVEGIQPVRLRCGAGRLDQGVATMARALSLGNVAPVLLAAALAAVPQARLEAASASSTLVR